MASAERMGYICGSIVCLVLAGIEYYYLYEGWKWAHSPTTNGGAQNDLQSVADQAALKAVAATTLLNTGASEQGKLAALQQIMGPQK